MELTIKERLAIRKLCPQQDTKINMILVRDIINKTDFTQNEIKEYNMVSVGQQITWGKDVKDIDKKVAKIDFTELELNFIDEKLRDLDTKKQIEISHLGLFDKVKGDKDTLKDSKKTK